ncbi:MAG: carbohydrate binding domain-containing protein, partial [Kiritimatiellae bacterium]|nr:carbohydrate binding domain-containing protein [Kiritimatiellia bacterium]
MKRFESLVLIGAVMFALRGFSGENLLKNGGFEEGFAAWRANDGGMSVCVPEAARSGKQGLRVVDRSGATGSSCRSAQIPVTPGTYYRIDYAARSRRAPDPGIAIYAKFQDGKGQDVDRGTDTELLDVVPVERAEVWTPCASCWKAPGNARYLTVWIHSFSTSLADIDLDDFAVREVSEAEGKAFVRPLPRTFASPDPAR